MPAHVKSGRLPRLNRGHPLASGLVACLVPTRAGSMIDLTGRRGSGAAAGLIDRGTFGLAARDWTLPAAQADLQFTSGPFSVAALVNLQHVAAAGEYPQVLGQDAYVSESNNQGWSLQLRASNDLTPGWSFNCLRNNGSGSGSAAVVDNGAATVVVGDHLIVGTSNGSNSRALYTDGLGPRATGTANANPVASASTLANAGTATVKVPIYWGMCWSRALSIRDVTALWTAPTALITTRRNRVGWTAAATDAGNPPPAARPAALLPMI